ncbi:MAG: alpha-hydroxy acid oxidase, partial [Methylophilaceae bacterium]|nr:alpha-hydroxy acid oxidase [Methylophilaceae bacterium]
MLADIQRVHDYQLLAKAQLDPAIWQYLCEGDSSGNAQAWHTRYLMPRPLRDVTGGNTRLTLFGQTLEHPILLAPLAYQRLFHQQGEMASAMAASMQGAPFIISSLASQALEAIADVAHAETQKSAWFQLYWQGERDRTWRLLQRAINAGCSVVVFTVDAPIKIARLQLPADVSAVNLEPLPLPQSKTSAVFNGWMSQAPTWDDVIWLRQQTRLPLVLKGLLHPDDVEKAIAVGCDGIVVSNHG